MGTSTDDESDAGVDGRQALLVVLCLFGLVTASLLAPVTGSNPAVGGDGGVVTDVLSDLAEFLTSGDEPDDSGEGGGGGDGEDGGSDPPEWLVDILRNLFDDDEGGGGGGGGEADCRVVVEQNPTPGSETTVRVLNEGDPQSGVSVWFNDRYVGETDGDGEATGVVPYVDRLNVTVQSEDTCTFTRQPSVGGVSVAAVPAAAVGGPLRTALAATGVSVGPDGGYAQADGGVNSSGEVQVDGDATVELLGRPYPNSTIDVVAVAGGTPIPDANVSVDGQRVGRTGADGRYTLSVPDRDSIRVTVSRGDVSGETTVDVWQLRLGFAPQLTVPGETVTANVTTSDGPVENASVALDGRRLGTTGADGRLRFQAPASVSGTLAATTGRQSTTVPLWRIYGLTLGASALLLALSTASTAVVARRSGRQRATRVAVGWLAAATLFVGFAVWEWLGLLGAGALVAVVAIYVFRDWLRDLLVRLSAVARRTLLWCQRMVLGIVSWLETVIDSLRVRAVRFAEWVQTQPNSVPGLAARLRRWLLGLPDRVRTAAGSASGRAVGAGLLAALVVVTSTALLGPAGFVLSAGLVVVTFVLWKATRYSPDRESTVADAGDSPTDGPPLGTDLGRPSLRELWRRVARWVLPDEWRTRTPTEISRAAIDAGLPREPVERLADAFRDVEYGGHAEQSRLDEAWRAYESLEAAEEDDG